LKLNRIATKWAVKTTRQAYQEMTDKTKVRLSILGAKKKKMFRKDLEKQTLTKYSSRIMDYLYKANASIRQSLNSYLHLVRRGGQAMTKFQHFNFDMEEEEEIQELIEEALRDGWARQRVTKQLEAYLRDKVEGGEFIKVGGRNYTIRYYAELIARTELRKAQSEAVKNLCEEYDNDLVEVSDHNTICDECKEYEGKIYSLSGESREYPMLSEEPPYHPNCEHHISPTSETALKFREIYG
jgi:hypothetical protein